MDLTPLIRRVQILVGTNPDGVAGPKTWEAIHRKLAGADFVQPKQPSIGIEAPGFNFKVEIEGEDLVVRGVRATCFGGSSDPQDSGETASGVSTKKHPEILGCALPMDYQGPHKPTRDALGGSPLPVIPWFTPVVFTDPKTGKTITVELIDLGPARATKNGADLSIAAARKFNPQASATNFSMVLDYRIPGGAKYLKTA